MRLHADLFTGIAGFSLGLENLSKPAVMCEICKVCRDSLKEKFPDAEIKEDIRTTTFTDGRNDIWLVCGGFPCQDISVAGKGAGLSGTRSGLWWEMRRVIDELRPAWVLAENVPALRTRGSDDVLSSLEELGYTLWPLVVGARHVGASQRRDRVWIVAYSHSHRIRFQSRRRSGESGGDETVSQESREELEHSKSKRRRAQRAEPKRQQRETSAGGASMGDTNCSTECTSKNEGGNSLVEAESLCAESTRDGCNGGVGWPTPKARDARPANKSELKRRSPDLPTIAGLCHLDQSNLTGKNQESTASSLIQHGSSNSWDTQKDGHQSSEEGGTNSNPSETP